MQLAPQFYAIYRTFFEVLLIYRTFFEVPAMCHTIFEVPFSKKV